MAHEPKLGTGKRFSNLEHSLASRGAKNPAALAAYIGREKYGAKGMGKLSHHEKMAAGGIVCPACGFDPASEAEPSTTEPPEAEVQAARRAEFAKHIMKKLGKGK